MADLVEDTSVIRHFVGHIIHFLIALTAGFRKHMGKRKTVGGGSESRETAGNESTSLV